MESTIEKHMETTEEKTQEEHQRERDLENIEQIQNSKDITGPLKLHGYNSF